MEVGSPEGRRLKSWTNTFLEYTANATAPLIFRRWAAYSAIAGVLQRKVWTVTYERQTFPNIYVFLVGPPGEGKSVAINEAAQIWRKLPAKRIHLGPNSGTRQRFYDLFINANENIIINNQPIMEQSSMLCPVGELQTLIRAHDLEMQSDLNAFYDCEEQWKHSIKGHAFGKDKDAKKKEGEDSVINFPCLSIVGGLTLPGLKRTLNDNAFDDGLGARVMLIYSQERADRIALRREKGASANIVDLDPFDRTKKLSEVGNSLVHDLHCIACMYGEFQFTDAAKKAYIEFERKSYLTEPTDPRLESYNVRRPRHLLKMAQIHSADRTNDLVIDIQDIDEAIKFMIQAERFMHIPLDVFGRNPLGEQTEIILRRVGEMFLERVKAGNTDGVPSHELRQRLQKEVDPRYYLSMLASLTDARQLIIVGKDARGSVLFKRADHLTKEEKKEHGC